MNMQKWKKYPCAIFDMDGTLVDSMPYWHRLGRDYLILHGLKPEADLEQQIAAMTLLESAEYFRDHYGLKLSADEIIQGVNELMEENYRLRIPAKPGAEAFVKALRDAGIHLHICSATPVPLVKVMLERLGILSCFESITSCEEAGAGKDRPDAYLLSLSRAGFKPEETILFEDADFAIRTALKLGLHVAAVYDASCRSTPEELRAAAEEYIVSFEDL